MIAVPLSLSAIDQRASSIAAEATCLLASRTGCLQLQDSLCENDPLLPIVVFFVVGPHLPDYASDPYANYVCQKLLDHLSDSQLARFTHQILKNVNVLAIDKHGSCVLRKLISCLKDRLASSSAAFQLLVELNSHLPQLASDPFGSLVLQACCTAFETGCPGIIDLIEYIRANMQCVAKDRYGCCLVKKALELQSPKVPLLVEAILSRIEALSIVSSSTDPYGNYVVQHLFDVLDENGIAEASECIREQSASLVTSRFGANVLVKTIRSGTKNVGSALVGEMTRDDQRLLHLAQDRHSGHQVIEACIETSNMLVARAILAKCRQIAGKIPNMTTRHRFIARLDEMNSLFS